MWVHAEQCVCLFTYKHTGDTRDAAGLKDALARAERRLVAGRGGCKVQGSEGHPLGRPSPQAGIAGSAAAAAATAAGAAVTMIPARNERGPRGGCWRDGEGGREGQGVYYLGRESEGVGGSESRLF